MVLREQLELRVLSVLRVRRDPLVPRELRELWVRRARSEIRAQLVRRDLLEPRGLKV